MTSPTQTQTQTQTQAQVLAHWNATGQRRRWWGASRQGAVARATTRPGCAHLFASTRNVPRGEMPLHALHALRFRSPAGEPPPWSLEHASWLRASSFGCRSWAMPRDASARHRADGWRVGMRGHWEMAHSVRPRYSAWLRGLDHVPFETPCCPSGREEGTPRQDSRDGVPEAWLRGTFPEERPWI